MTTRKSIEAAIADGNATVTGTVVPKLPRQNPSSPKATENGAATPDKAADDAEVNATSLGKHHDPDADGKSRIVRNQTPHRLVVTTADGGRIAFAPLEARAFSAARLPTVGLDDLGLLKAAEKKEIDKLGTATQIFAVALWPVIIGWVVLANLMNNDSKLTAWVWVAAAVVVAASVIIAFVVMTEQEPFVGRLVAQTTTLVFVLAVSVGIPTVTVARFADEDFWSMSGLDVFVRLCQIAIISVASMLPGLLFFFFDRQKLSTLRNRFERQIFRLDPNVETLADVDARYGRQLEETYGTSQSGEGLRLARQRRLPILVGTIVLTISWTIALSPVASLPADLTPAGIGDVLAPHPDPVSFGFLGAYFYALNLVWRRYTRGDLRPKAYSAITVRILIVLVVTWVVAAVAPDNNDWVLVLSFLIGIVPETVFVLLREWFAGSRGSKFALKALEEPQPLQDLEGMDLYDRARLLDEGISNVQALSHHDLVDLLLETRVPAGRLVDWVDQSVLYLHCADASEPSSESSSDDGDGDESDGNGAGAGSLLQRLHLVGIRTATDFEVAMVKGRHALLNHQTDGRKTFKEPVLQLLLTSLSDDEWLQYVRHWRRDEPVRKMLVGIDADGRVVDGPEFAAATVPPRGAKKTTSK